MGFKNHSRSCVKLSCVKQHLTRVIWGESRNKGCGERWSRETCRGNLSCVFADGLSLESTFSTADKDVCKLLSRILPAVASVKPPWWMEFHTMRVNTWQQIIFMLLIWPWRSNFITRRNKPLRLLWDNKLAFSWWTNTINYSIDRAW